MIRVGIGGWTYEPWRGSFFPADLPRARELEYASRKLTTIEINGTFYRTQSAASFARWRDATPDGFVFSVKAHRYATSQKVLAQAGDAIRHFVGSGIAELGPKLGPILWQFSEYKRFEPGDFEAFLELLPRSVGGIALRHALDVRHKSFACAEFVALARRYGAAIVFSDTDEYPSFADLSGDFVYARLMRCEASQPTGYSAEALERWARRARAWESGAEPDDLPRVGASPAPAKPRDVFVYFISGAKERAPAAACALLSRL